MNSLDRAWLIGILGIGLIIVSLVAIGTYQSREFARIVCADPNSDACFAHTAVSEGDRAVRILNCKK